MSKKLIINCPPMGVTNLGYWWQITHDRVTDNLPCTGHIEGLGNLSITFPPCYVRFISPGHWMVDALVAEGHLRSGEYLRIAYPEESVIRRGKYLYAQPIPNIVSLSYVEIRGGIRLSIHTIIAPLPEARSVPVGLGIRKFIVDAVTIEGSVDL